MVTLPEVIRACHRMGGRWGSKDAQRLVAAAADGTSFAAERTFARLMDTAGIVGWVVNAPLPGSSAVPDFRLERARLIVEIDGWAWHHTPGRFQRDRTRQNELVLAGWRVLRFTWTDLTERPDEVVQLVRAAVVSSGA